MANHLKLTQQITNKKIIISGIEIITFQKNIDDFISVGAPLVGALYPLWVPLPYPCGCPNPCEH
jgi:hypothetical protein